MAAEVTMPQLSDTMTEGTVVKWHKNEGDKIKAGEKIADVETDKAVMEMEAFDSGTLAIIKVQEGQKVPVGGLLAVIATAGENVEEVKKQHSAAAAPVALPQPQTKPELKAAPPPAAKAAATARYDYDILVIGGGPAGYAAAIRAGQLKKKVLCVEKENLGGTCLNWGCIPSKALLEDGAFIRKLRTEAAAHGVSFEHLKIDFPKLIGRSRAIAEKLSKGIASLFHKYGVKSEMARAQLIGPHRVKIGSKEITADHIIIAVGAKSTPLPGVEFDGKKIFTSREAMTLPHQPKRLAIIGAGAIGCEFADFYNAVGSEVVLIEMLDHLLPNEDGDVAAVLHRVFEKRKIDIRTKTKTAKVQTTAHGVKLTLEGAKPGSVTADGVLVAIGVTGIADGAVDPQSGLELQKGRVKVAPDYRTNLQNVWAIGDCVTIAGDRHPDLAHVAHHEAVHLVDRIVDGADHSIDYRQIPACTYTHPQVASMGYTEKRAGKLATN